VVSESAQRLPTRAVQTIHLQDELMRLTNLLHASTTSHSRQNSTTANAASGPGQQVHSLLSAGASLGRAVAAPAVVGRNVLITAGTGLRDLIVPESLATAITSNLTLNLNLATWGGGNDGKDVKDAELAKERAEQLKTELDELLAAVCPLCESLVIGLDKPFVFPGEVDHSWDL